jgi:hypothetical protein
MAIGVALSTAMENTGAGIAIDAALAGAQRRRQPAPADEDNS